MNKPLKLSIQNHLKSIELSTEQLQNLKKLQHSSNTSIPKITALFNIFKVASVASIILCSILSIYLFNQADFFSQSLEQRIALEVANNHLKLKPLETNSHNIQGIKSYFKQLDFSPVTPDFLKTSQQSLLGGRYCSIQGITAAQLRLRDNKTGQIQSLYETQYDKNIFKHIPQLERNEKPLFVYVKGIKVKIWVEKGILFALTGSQPAE